MFGHYGKERYVLAAAVDERVLHAHRVVVNLSGHHSFLFALADEGGNAREDIHDLGIGLMTVESDRTARLQTSEHDFHLLVGIVAHDVAALSALELGDDSVFYLVEINYQGSVK